MPTSPHSDAVRAARRFLLFMALILAIATFSEAFRLSEAWFSGVFQVWSKTAGHRILLATEHATAFWFQFWLSFSLAIVLGLSALGALALALVATAHRLETASSVLKLQNAKYVQFSLRKWTVSFALVAFAVALVLTIRSA